MEEFKADAEQFDKDMLGLKAMERYYWYYFYERKEDMELSVTPTPTPAEQIIYLTFSGKSEICSGISANKFLFTGNISAPVFYDVGKNLPGYRFTYSGCYRTVR